MLRSSSSIISEGEQRAGKRRGTIEVGRKRERGEYKEGRSEVRKIRKPSRKRQKVKDEEARGKGAEWKRKRTEEEREQRKRGCRMAEELKGKEERKGVRKWEISRRAERWRERKEDRGGGWPANANRVDAGRSTGEDHKGKWKRRNADKRDTKLRISPRIFIKIWNGHNRILRGPGETDSWKNLKSKSSCQTPFKSWVQGVTVTLAVSSNAQQLEGMGLTVNTITT
jgi:hypothetical protein